MLYPIAKLLVNQGEVVTIHAKATVRDALIKMAKHNFSQLPVVDDAGNLTGLISEQTLTRAYYHANDSVSLFNLTVDHCQTRAVTLTADEDLFDALDHLQRTATLVITEGRKPIGLLTLHDTTHFFRRLTEGQMYVEDIETTLRDYVESVYPTPEQMDQALINAFGQKDGRPTQDFHNLTFGQQIYQITTARNWPDFEPFFAPQPLFKELMGAVRQIRNQIAHFRGALDSLQFDTLRRANDWLASRPPKPKPPVTQPETVTVASAEPNPAVTATLDPTLDKSKYAPLARWLQQQDAANPVSLTFAELETRLGAELPKSARQHRSWWSNEPRGHSQAHAWLATGWQVDEVDLAAEQVTFRYNEDALYRLFFAETVERLHAIRPDIGEVKTSEKLHYCNFSAGRVGFTFGWTLKRHTGLFTELYIDTRNAEQNQKAFAQLVAHKAEIEAKVGDALHWVPLLGSRAARISLIYPFAITDPPNTWAAAQTWAVETLLKFMDAFQPYLKEL